MSIIKENPTIFLSAFRYTNERRDGGVFINGFVKEGRGNLIGIICRGK